MKKILGVILCLFTIFQSTAFAYSHNNPMIDRYLGTNGNSVLVLMYHRLSNNPIDLGDFSITPADFENDVRLLSEAGYVFCTASQLPKLVREKGKKYVAITFDDGYASDYVYALPVLNKYNAKATFFIFGGAIGREEYLTETQLLELSKSPNVEIGNHSYSIHDKTYEEIKQLTVSNQDFLINDYIKNKELIEKIISKNVTALSYPNGIYNGLIDLALRSKTGIQISFSTEERIERFPITSRVIGRINRGPYLNMRNLIK